MSREHRRIAAWALAAYAVMVAAVVLSPDASVASGVVGGAERVLVALGVLDALTAPGRVEFVINAAMFVPLTLLAALVRGCSGTPRRTDTGVWVTRPPRPCPAVRRWGRPPTTGAEVIRVASYCLLSLREV